jgi:hypothetical protein
VERHRDYRLSDDKRLVTRCRSERQVRRENHATLAPSSVVRGGGQQSGSSETTTRPELTASFHVSASNPCGMFEELLVWGSPSALWDWLPVRAMVASSEWRNVRGGLELLPIILDPNLTVAFPPVLAALHWGC